MAFVTACAAADLQPGQGKAVELNGQRIALFRIGENYHAIDDLCTHDEASLAEGCILEENGACRVECPWHGAQFDLHSGAALSLPAVKPVRTYRTRVENGALQVEL